MSMKTHILAALREAFDQWAKALDGLSEATVTRVPEPGVMSIKDELAHLLAWQQRSIARMEAARNGEEPKMPVWSTDAAPLSEDDVDQINARIYDFYKDHSWPTLYQEWQSGFLHFIEVSEAIAEPALLDSSRYAWLGGYSLADVILSTYEHHQEHLDRLLA